MHKKSYVLHHVHKPSLIYESGVPDIIAPRLIVGTKLERTSSLRLTPHTDMSVCGRSDLVHTAVANGQHGT